MTEYQTGKIEFAQNPRIERYFIPFGKQSTYGTATELEDDITESYQVGEVTFGGSFMMTYGKIDIDEIYSKQKKGVYPLSYRVDGIETKLKATGHKVDFDNWSITVDVVEAVSG